MSVARRTGCWALAFILGFAAGCGRPVEPITWRGHVLADTRMSIPQLATLVPMTDPDAVRDEALLLAKEVQPAVDRDALARAWADMVRLFHGEYPGYRACNTPYHNLQHTTDVTLATIRLLHGAKVEGTDFSRDDVSALYLAALFHDIGYIQTDAETEGSGSALTAVHVARGREFVKTYLAKHPIAGADGVRVAAIIHFTDMVQPVDGIPTEKERDRLLGQLMAAGDLLGQLADRTYLEKLPLLYQEFKEAGVGGFTSELDLLSKTVRFHEVVQERLTRDLGSVDFYMQPHFRERWNIDEDLYAEAIMRNLAYLRELVRHHETDWPAQLKRRPTGEYHR